jgi:aminopeptidase N
MKSRCNSRLLRHASGLLALLLCPPILAKAGELHHSLVVSISPDDGGIEVVDTISLPSGSTGALEFTLHPGLQPELPEDGATLHRLPAASSPAGVPAGAPAHYRVSLPPGQQRLVLRYRGRIRHALEQQGEEYARSFRETRGMISVEGVYLAGTSHWYPQFDAGLLTFDLELQLPEGWKGMSQGMRTAPQKPGGSPERWRCMTPQEEIYLVAGPFTEYASTDDGVQALVLLRRPDAALAQKYLDATHRYITLYEQLIGPYPFSKFALVENFWETGYGMPSFTLLGPKVIRLPFILHTSYPHEILHNWWGNGVYVDYAGGNWSEGLTSYLADHLVKEQQGHDADYRRTTLQKYADYVGREKDFPLTAFRGRHSARTEAVGYGKTLMLFHMLRRQVGDARFIDGLQTLYRHYRFKTAGFPELERVFSETAQQPLDGFFEQWVERTGAPQLRASRVQAQAVNGGYRLQAVIEQTQAGEPYELELPLAVTLEGREQAWETVIRLTQRQQTLQLELPARPLQLDLDPAFDIFRRLHRSETPPAISQAVGADRVLVVLPADAEPSLQTAYKTLAAGWQQDRGGQVEIVTDASLDSLPDDRAVWLFGWNNRFRQEFAQALQAYDYGDNGTTLQLGESRPGPASHSIVIMARQPQNVDLALGWLAADSAAAVPGLGRKLPHYGRYSYLAFTGTAPDNILKGQWPVVGSPMSICVAQQDGAVIDYRPAPTAPRSPLVAPPERFSAARMAADIDFLASPAMAGRGLGTAELGRAADWIASQFAAAGLQPGGDDGGWYQAWEAPVEQLGRNITLRNVVGILPGSDPLLAGESLVIGAHYDHFGRGEHAEHAAHRRQVHPGADDNASGIAVMLELARALEGKPLPRTLVFAAFTGEESGRLGSRHYVRHAGLPAERAIAMLNLDTVGRLGERPLLILGTGTADAWPHIFRGAGYVTGVPVQAVADDIGSGDQTSFIEAGVPAVQLFAGVHEDIHRPGDTPDKIDSEGLVRVARVLHETVQYLGGRREPLASTRTGSASDTAATTGEKRRVSFGTVPDFSWDGQGVRLEDVRPGTPAAQAGLRAGDIIVEVNEAAVTDMRSYSNALRQLSPGDEIRVRFSRDSSEQRIVTRVTER